MADVKDDAPIAGLGQIIKQLALSIVHLVDARACRQRFNKSLVIELVHRLYP